MGEFSYPLMHQHSLEFHIQENDYFGTLATVLDLVRQDLERCGFNAHAETLSRLRNDLVYLQSSYCIEQYEGRGKSGG